MGVHSNVGLGATQVTYLNVWLRLRFIWASSQGPFRWLQKGQSFMKPVSLRAKAASVTMTCGRSRVEVYLVVRLRAVLAASSSFWAWSSVNCFSTESLASVSALVFFSSMALLCLSFCLVLVRQRILKEKLLVVSDLVLLPARFLHAFLFVSWTYVIFKMSHRGSQRRAWLSWTTHLLWSSMLDCLSRDTSGLRLLSLLVKLQMWLRSSCSLCLLVCSSAFSLLSSCSSLKVAGKEEVFRALLSPAHAWFQSILIWGAHRRTWSSVRRGDSELLWHSCLLRPSWDWLI